MKKTEKWSSDMTKLEKKLNKREKFMIRAFNDFGAKDIKCQCKEEAEERLKSMLENGEAKKGSYIFRRK